MTTTETPADETDIPPGGDDFLPLPDGRIRIRIDGITKAIMLSAPKLGEFKALKQRLNDMTAALSDRAEELLVAQAELQAQPADPEPVQVARTKAIVENMKGQLAGAAITDEQAEDVAGLSARIINTLGDCPDQLSADDMPLWLCEASIIGRMFTHWRQVPLGRGR